MLNPLSALSLALAFAIGTPVAAEEALSKEEREEVREEIRSYLLQNPEILLDMFDLLEEREAAAKAESDRLLVDEHSKAIFDDGFSYVGGNPEGSVTVVEFLDYQCTYCRRAHPDLQKLIADDGDIRWIVKEMPILGPGSDLAARAAVATLIAEGPEAYAGLNDRLMRLEGPISDAVLDHTLEEAGIDPAEIRAAMEAPEVERRIAATHDLAKALQITGTPTFVVDQVMVRGYVPPERMQALVAEARED